jgi:hypothetical protein
MAASASSFELGSSSSHCQIRLRPLNCDPVFREEDVEETLIRFNAARVQNFAPYIIMDFIQCRRPAFTAMSYEHQVHPIA